MVGKTTRTGGSNQNLLNRRILVVEDDATVREVVVSYMRAAGFLVEEAGDGLLALRMVQAAMPDLVILDRLLPGVGGIQVAVRMHGIGPVPIIMLTALGSTEDRIQGLEAGVDDYLAKPFSARELVLRVRSVLKRTLVEFAPQTPFDVGEFRLEPSRHSILQAGRPLSLSNREYELLAFLLRHPDQVFTREQLLRGVWHWEFGDLSTVTVHVRRLREKIEYDLAKPTILRTVWGVGYQLSV